MLNDPPEFVPPATVAALRGFGAAALVATAGVAYAAFDCAPFVPVTPAAYLALSALVMLVPAAAASVAYGLATIAESTARTAWELRIRRR